MKPIPLLYQEQETLKSRNGEDLGAIGILLVATEAVIEYDTYGYGTSHHEHIKLYPAFHDGKRCWLERRWFTNGALQESILSFERGIEIFVTRGVFEFPAPPVDDAPLQK